MIPRSCDKTVVDGLGPETARKKAREVLVQLRRLPAVPHRARAALCRLAGLGTELNTNDGGGWAHRHGAATPLDDDLVEFIPNQISEFRGAISNYWTAGALGELAIFCGIQLLLGLYYSFMGLIFLPIVSAASYPHGFASAASVALGQHFEKGIEVVTRLWRAPSQLAKCPFLPYPCEHDHGCVILPRRLVSLVVQEVTRTVSQSKTSTPVKLERDAGF
ncbi:hypothetical protein PG997_001728 [Apiospora hydei]|uniref:Uncharacterized protein n=1 Tax=Apiospora hydei TaxID=1337664 RepID=A0ABR1XEK5_9PEZI